MEKIMHLAQTIKYVLATLDAYCRDL